MKSLILAASFAALSAAQSGVITDNMNPAFSPELAATLGINCRGSGLCGIEDWGQGGLLGRLRGQVNSIDGGHWYQNGENIVCEEDVAGGGICAFLQGTGGMPGSSIGGLLDALIQHGCEKCGSVPVWLPVNGDNNPNDHGILTVNAVGNAHKCNGLCGTGGSKSRGTANSTMNAFAQPAAQGQVRLICTQETV